MISLYNESSSGVVFLEEMTTSLKNLGPELDYVRKSLISLRSIALARELDSLRKLPISLRILEECPQQT